MHSEPSLTMKAALVLTVNILLAGSQGQYHDSHAKETRIRGGMLATYGEFPYTVALFNTSMTQEVACGGTIINENYIVTSARCMSKYASRASNEMYAILGASFLILNGTKYGLSSVTIHEGYNETLHAHDIAVVRVNRSIVFTNAIQPIKLPDDDDFIKGGQRVMELGYGQNSPPFEKNVLVKLEVKTMDTTTCQQRFREFDIMIYKSIHLCVETAIKTGVCYLICSIMEFLHMFVCCLNFERNDLSPPARYYQRMENIYMYLTWPHKKVTYADDCFFTESGLHNHPQGDYGAPLIKNGTLVGIASFNILCGQGYPDVYTRASYYSTWIEINTQPDLQ